MRVYIYLFIVRTFRNAVSIAEVAIWLGKKEGIRPNLNFQAFEKVDTDPLQGIF
jgi:hypothetical protein